jgi:glyoxylase-like metal-dependent hydrolase (beta-lactamase superfamily II)
VKGWAVGAARADRADRNAVDGCRLRPYDRPRSHQGVILMRGTPLSAVLLSLLTGAGAAVAQQDTDWSKVEVTATQVSGNIYLLKGEGGNIAASLGEDGIVIVDDQFAPLAGKIEAALKALRLTERPVRFVINTHFHYDHSGGNQPFGSAGTTIVAHDKVRERLLVSGTSGTGGALNFENTPQPREALPVITFGESLTLHLNGEDIHALHFPAGHTDGDAIVFFPRNNVVHMGDNFVRYGFPFIDVLSGGSVQGMIAGLTRAIAKLPADVKVIPGHGELATLDDVRRYIRMLEETSAAVSAAIAAKMTVEQMKQERILEPWREAWVPESAFIDADAFIDTLYNSLTGTAGTLVRHN